MSVTAMKQALEALEWNYNTDLDNIPACEQWSKMLKQNITALRQAIEQAEQAQPVAVYRAGQAPGEVYHVQFFKEMNADEVLLYTAPLQRQPLTEEEIAKIASTPCAVVGSYVHTFARAIEAAHGITQGQPVADGHVTDGTKCWCEPELDYKDPDTGAEVWIHRGKQ